MNDTITIKIKKPPLLDGYEYCERAEATHGSFMEPPRGEWSHWLEHAPNDWTSKDYIYAWSRPIPKEEPEYPPIPKFKKTKVFDCEVSTVFLGIDHQYEPGGPPIVFETLVFGGKLDKEMERYSTWEEAEAGHDAMCVRVNRAYVE